MNDMPRSRPAIMVGYQQDRRRGATFAGAAAIPGDIPRMTPGFHQAYPPSVHTLCKIGPSPCHGTCGALAARVPQGNCCFPMQAKSAEWP
ncbi:MAG TPA: hypothetical protein VE087_08455, partial [Xanthobacteraceae bacterium]|nr:hypothetical protein [Xanthobacteraceae bacterium]